MQKTCLKCGHVNPSATGDDLEACPSCEAIYSRVEAALARKSQSKPPAPAPAPRPPAPAPFVWKGREAIFLDQLRRDSNYPTFRSVVGLFTGIGYLLAAVVALGGATAMVTTNFLVGGIPLLVAVVIFVLTRLGKEIWLMVADGCDALVHMAARQESQSRDS